MLNTWAMPASFAVDLKMIKMTAIPSKPTEMDWTAVALTRTIFARMRESKRDYGKGLITDILCKLPTGKASVPLMEIMTVKLWRPSRWPRGRERRWQNWETFMKIGNHIRPWRWNVFLIISCGVNKHHPALTILGLQWGLLYAMRWHMHRPIDI